MLSENGDEFKNQTGLIAGLIFFVFLTISGNKPYHSKKYDGGYKRYNHAAYRVVKPDSRYNKQTCIDAKV